MMQPTLPTAAALGLGLSLVLGPSPVRAAPPPHHAPAPQPSTLNPQPSDSPLPALPENLPGWMNNTRRGHIFYRRGPYNFAIYDIPPLARDLNAVAVGHAMAYEDLVTGKAATLDTKTFDRIDGVLRHPPKLMPDEAAIAPTFGRRYGVLEQVFDWTHILHAQTVDVLASTKLTPAQKDAEIERLWKFYFESVPYAITPLPMNMAFLDSQPYSGAFRRKYPRVNGLFWGYHWLQGAMYDLLYRTTLPQQRAAYNVLGERYHKVELYRTDREFMPMFAETSPEFAARFPHIANTFDNLHMLHDLVNDILASDWMSEKQKNDQITRALWMVSAETHKGEKPGDVSVESSSSNKMPRIDRMNPQEPPHPPHPVHPVKDSEPEAALHDHRFAQRMPGMGMMKGSTPELMYMPGMGWMSMADCAHCSMPLPGDDESWRAPTVTAEGWSMRVRCALCARDMAAQTRGRAIIRVSTEDPARKLVLISDEAGNWKTDMPGVVFLEQEGGHASCDRWSRAFTSRAAFDAYVNANPRYQGARPLTLAEWSQQEGKEPDTYVKPKGPVENPYRDSASRRDAGNR